MSHFQHHLRSVHVFFESNREYPPLANDRRVYAPDIDIDIVPAFVALTSTNNIPIEGGWHQLRKAIGGNLYHHVMKGKDGPFNPNLKVHSYVTALFELSSIAY